MLYDTEDKKKFLKANLSQKRYQHSLNVAAECRKLAEKYGEDPDKAYFAGLLHDICKELPADEQLELPGFRDIAELLIDGVSQGKRGLAPYIFHLPAGKHRLVLRCWNSMANRMERYAASAGLCRPPAIIHH